VGAAEEVVTPDRIVIEPSERRQAVLRIIRGARKRLGLTIFRCNERRPRRGACRHRARRGRGRAAHAAGQRLAAPPDELRTRLDVWAPRQRGTVRRPPNTTPHRGRQRSLLVASFNLTRKCFHDTCDFAVVTHDPDAVTDAWRLRADLAKLRCRPRRRDRGSWSDRSGRPGGARSALERHLADRHHRPQLDDARVLRILKQGRQACGRHTSARGWWRREAHGKI
jgi:hypothetical protein